MKILLGFLILLNTIFILLGLYTVIVYRKYPIGEMFLSSPVFAYVASITLVLDLICFIGWLSYVIGNLFL
jgi:hypothetical protein